MWHMFQAVERSLRVHSPHLFNNHQCACVRVARKARNKQCSRQTHAPEHRDRATKDCGGTKDILVFLFLRTRSQTASSKRRFFVKFTPYTDKTKLPAKPAYCLLGTLNSQGCHVALHALFGERNKTVRQKLNFIVLLQFLIVQE